MSKIKLDMAYAAIRKMEDELAALREELANETGRANMNILKARHAKQDLNSIQQRLADAERRNAELLDLLRECQPALDKAGYSTWQIDEALKPTESGASE